MEPADSIGQIMLKKLKGLVTENDLPSKEVNLENDNLVAYFFLLENQKYLQRVRQTCNLS